MNYLGLMGTRCRKEMARQECESGRYGGRIPMSWGVDVDVDDDGRPWNVSREERVVDRRTVAEATECNIEHIVQTNVLRADRMMI